MIDAAAVQLRVDHMSSHSRSCACLGGLPFHTNALGGSFNQPWASKYLLRRCLGWVPGGSKYLLRRYLEV